MAVTVKITLIDYTISFPHLVNLAGEFEATTGPKTGFGAATAVEFNFIGTSASPNARAFRRVLDTGFVKRSKSEKPGEWLGGECGAEGEDI